VHKPLVVNVVVVGLFEEEEEGTGIASDVVKVLGEDPDTPGYLRGDRVRLGRLRSWIVGGLPWLAHDEAPGPYITIPQYQFNKTKQHTLISGRQEEVFWTHAPSPPIGPPSFSQLKLLCN